MPGNNDPARTLTPSAGLPGSQLVPGRETAGSWPATQHRARHARAPAGQEGTSGHGQVPAAMPPRPPSSKPAAEHGQAEVQQARRKPAVTRRAMLGLAAATTAGLAAAGWDLSHRTATPGRTPAPHPSGGTPLWTTTIPNNSGLLAFIQAVVGGVVYVFTGGEQLALRADNGAQLWSSGSMTFIGSTPRGTVYAIGGDGLYALRAIDGRQIWHTKFRNLHRAVIDGNVIFTMDQSGEVCAVNAENGNEIWSLPTFNKGLDTITAANGEAYFGGADAGHNVYAARGGREIWRSPIVAADAPANIWDGLAVSGNLVYVNVSGNDSSKLYALRTSDGVEAWNFRLDDGGMFVIGDGIVYLCGDDSTVYALAADSGVKLWQFHTGGNGFPPVAIARRRRLRSRRWRRICSAREGWQGNMEFRYSCNRCRFKSNGFKRRIDFCGRDCIRG